MTARDEAKLKQIEEKIKNVDEELKKLEIVKANLQSQKNTIIQGVYK